MLWMSEKQIEEFEFTLEDLQRGLQNLLDKANEGGDVPIEIICWAEYKRKLDAINRKKD
jgi:hypothetical protein